MCLVRSRLSSKIAEVDNLAEIVGIIKLVSPRTEKIKRIAKQTQISSLKVPLEKMTRKPDSVRTRTVDNKTLEDNQ